MLLSHLEAPKSAGSILLSNMTRVLFYPHAHLIRKRLNRVGVSNYIRAASICNN
jgi:hypothetical protein